jgi:hypothetical protein
VQRQKEVFELSETIDSLREKLAEPDAAFDNGRCHLIGLLAAELVATATEEELSQAVVMIKDLQRGANAESSAYKEDTWYTEADPDIEGYAPTEADVYPDGNVQTESALSVRESLLSVVSSLLQSVLGDHQSTGRVSLPLSVQERVLNLLMLGPHEPIHLSNAIGCSPDITSRALTGLQEAGFIEPTPESNSADGLVSYELTASGQMRQDKRFFGEPIDELVDQPYDYGRVLAPLTQVVAELNTNDPLIARALYPGLHILTNQVYDPQLRAAAANELGGAYISNPVIGSTDRPRIG